MSKLWTRILKSKLSLKLMVIYKNPCKLKKQGTNMRFEDRIEKSDKGYRVHPDKYNVEKISLAIHKTLSEIDALSIDALTAMSILCIQISISCDMGKPHFLSTMSNAWETIDKIVNEQDDY